MIFLLQNFEKVVQHITMNQNIAIKINTRHTQQLKADITSCVT